MSNTLAISCIAWEPSQQAPVQELLQKHAISAVEGAPSLFSTDFTLVSDAQALSVKETWQAAGFRFCAMQALLFGQPQLKLFGSQEEREQLRAFLQEVFRVAQSLGAKYLVFGSPKNRLKGELSAEEAHAMAVDFFRTVAADAAARDCVLCMEANATGYGCDFITTHAEAIELVHAVNHAGFGLQIDCGVMLMNGESPSTLLQDLQKYNLMPSHVHLSAPFLEPLGVEDAPFYTEVTSALSNYGYEGAFSLEMKKPPVEQSMETIDRTLALVRSFAHK